MPGTTRRFIRIASTTRHGNASSLRLRLDGDHSRDAVQTT